MFDLPKAEVAKETAEKSLEPLGQKFDALELVHVSDDSIGWVVKSDTNDIYNLSWSKSTGWKMYKLFS